MLPNTVSNKHRPDCHSSNTTIQRHRSSSCGNSEKDTDISYCDFTNNDQTQNTLASNKCCIESDAEQYFVNKLSRKTSSSSHVAPSDLISYGSCNSLNYRSRTSLNSSCSAHHHHHHHHKTVRRNKCPHHRRKHSTSCVLLGSKRTSRSTSVHGSTSSIYEPLQGDESSFSIANMVLTPSKITIEHSETGDKTFPQNVPNDPDYISSPIKWNYVCDGDGNDNKTEYIEVSTQPSTSSSKNDGPNRQKSSDVKTVSIWRTDNEESNAIIFHHESEIVENCCENYFHCNYPNDDQASMRAKFGDNFPTNNHEVPKSTERLNNTIEMIPSHSAPLDILNRNNISSVINQLNLSPEFRHYEKMTNLSQQNSANLTPSRFTRTNQNCNLLNQNMENNNFTEDKFINTSRNSTLIQPAQPQPHSSTELNAAHSSLEPSTSAALRNFELFNIATPSSLPHGKPLGINLTTQNQFHTSHNSRSPNSNSLTGGHHSNSLLNVSFESSSVISNRWQQVTNTIGLSGLTKIVRKRARKCAEFIKGDK